MRNKRGQFYLVATIIIITLIASIIAIVNYTKKSSIILADDFAKELKIETQKVLNYDVVNGDNKINQYGIDYSKHIGSDIELYFIMGDNPNIYAYKYLNGVESDVSDETLVIDETDKKIIFNLDGTNYEFKLNDKGNFYYLISQKIKGENFVATS